MSLLVSSLSAITETTTASGIGHELVSSYRSPCVETTNAPPAESNKHRIIMMSTPTVVKSAKRTRRSLEVPESSAKKRRSARSAKKSSALPSTPVVTRPQSVPQMTKTLTPKSIDERAVQLFGSSEGILPRIFSCYSPRLNLGDKATPSRKDKPSQDPVMALLRALVQVEVMSSQDKVTPDVAVRRDDENGKASKRRIQFCSWNGSAVLPPVDRVEGSSAPLSQVLDALVNFQNIIRNSLTPSDAPSLRRIVDGLQTSPPGNVSSFAELCAQSISTCSVKQVQDAVDFYKQEFSLLLNRLDEGTLLNENALQYFSAKGPFLALEHHLATWLGQAIRYNLRMLLNPAPPKLGRADTEYTERCKIFSQISKSIRLTGGPEDSSVISEVNLATLVSKALDAVYSYLGDAVLSSDPLANRTGEEIWSREHNTLLKPVLERWRYNQPPLIKTPELIKSLQEVAFEASQFMACYGGAQFLVDLFQLELVQQEMERCGGIQDIETYATWLWNFELYRICDAHFVLLSNLTAIVERLARWTQRTQLQAEACFETLKELKSRVKKWPKNDRQGLDELFEYRLAEAQAMPRVELL